MKRRAVRLDLRTVRLINWASLPPDLPAEFLRVVAPGRATSFSYILYESRVARAFPHINGCWVRPLQWLFRLYSSKLLTRAHRMLLILLR